MQIIAIKIENTWLGMMQLKMMFHFKNMALTSLWKGSHDFVSRAEECT